MISLRDRLRGETAPWHERVDRAYSTLDLRRAADFETFLGAQMAVLRAIQCRPGCRAEDAEPLRADMIAALTADLRDLGRGPVPSGATHQFDATAVLYILLGSRMGTQVLRRRWLEATDPAVASAGRYLGLATPASTWRAFCAELMQAPGQGAEADRIVGDACRLFDLHLGVLPTLARAHPGESHAA